MEEIWEDIEGYKGEYAISNLGRIKSIKNNIVMKPMLATNGYLVACLWHNGKQKKIVIHRLVAQAFVPNPNNYNEVNHIDENKTNNKADNLEWCTHKYNMNYGDIKHKISQGNIGKICPEDRKQQISKQSSNSIWINNGIAERFIIKEKAIELLNNGWIKGRLRKVR